MTDIGKLNPQLDDNNWLRAVQVNVQIVMAGANKVRLLDTKSEPWSASFSTAGPRSGERWKIGGHRFSNGIVAMRNGAVLALVMVLVMVVFAARGLEAADGDEARKTKALEERNLWRLEWDNDAFVRVDNGFTNGWSLQRHSHQYDAWNEMGPSKFSAWISRKIPGLDDDGGRVVKRGTGLSQIIMTPEDLENPDPQPGDVPWAGSLGWAESWYAFDNQTLNAFQIYFGILGPYSLAESLQVRLHDLINADEPLGWDNQLRTEPLLNLNYTFKRKLVSTGNHETKSFAGDFSFGLEGALGNMVTSAGLTFEGRFGWGLPKGFAQLPDPPGYGIMLDPEKGVSGKAHVYFSVVYRVGATVHTVFLDGNVLRDSPHPGLEYDTISQVTVFGFHADRGRYAIHFNFYKYNDLPIESVNPLTDLTWGNITFECRF